MENSPVFEELKTALGKLKASGYKRKEYPTFAAFQSSAKKLGYYIHIETLSHFINKYWDLV